MARLFGDAISKIVSMYTNHLATKQLLLKIVELEPYICSLVPRPFPPPVFDRLQYANTEGEGLGDLVTCSYVR